MTVTMQNELDKRGDRIHRETRIDGVKFEGEDTEDALVNASKGFAMSETCKSLDPQGKFSKS
jgi:hypothetical protein